MLSIDKRSIAFTSTKNEFGTAKVVHTLKLHLTAD